ncbi:NADH-quinone oxidoreductase subunit D [bacterium]|nr:NADH-quinone oxidoreductase subunit D [bacterium]
MSDSETTVALEIKPTAYQQQLLDLLSSLHLAGIQLSDFSKTGVDFDAVANSETLPAAASALRDNGFALDCILGIDRNPGLEAVYLFRPFADGARVRIRAQVAPDRALLPTITGIYSGADWYEREVHDMFGIVFEGHSHLRPLLLPHFTNFHPLRKNFHGSPIVIPEDTVEIPEVDLQAAMKLGQTDRTHRDFFLNMGPQHPSTHGVLRILLHVEGEEVLGGRCHLGYSHRGTEKLAEKKQYVQILPYTDRMDYLAPLNYNWGYAALLERATGIESTPRAEAIRVAIGELARVSSHLVWLGTFMLDLGAITPFLFCFEDRERILTVFERATGQRMTTSYIVVGGVRNDVYDGFIQDVRDLLDYMRKRLPEYDRLVMTNEIFLQRTRGVGVITAQQARDQGVTGPVLRGSGVDFDLRRDEPYCPLYQELKWNVVVEQEGDCLARSRVRMREMDESLNLIEQALERIEEGPYRAKIPRNFKVNAGEYYSATEGPRGMVGWYLVADGSMTPYRLKVRVPSFPNLQVVESLIPHSRVADVVAILGSVDVVIPEIDR